MIRKKALILAAAALVMTFAASCGTAGRLKEGTRVTDPGVKAAIAENLDSLETLAAGVLKAAYMTENYVRTDKSIPGWEGYPVKLYTYHTGMDKEFGCRKLGKVYLLMPDKRQLAMWVATAVYSVEGRLDLDKCVKLFNFIKWQSGAQFPVSGVVYEDMEGDGTYYPYLFKDGITVYVPDGPWKSLNPDEKQLDFYLTMKNEDLKPYTGRYARICSTTREQYKANGGTMEVGTSDSEQTRIHAWMDAIREEYQKAWNSDFNMLITAWARQNLDTL